MRDNRSTGLGLLLWSLPGNHSSFPPSLRQLARAASVPRTDVGGCDKIRPLWRHYFQNTDGVVFMVDANDRDRHAEVRSGTPIAEERWAGRLSAGRVGSGARAGPLLGTLGLS
jgi:hypothetical protein